MQGIYLPGNDPMYADIGRAAAQAEQQHGLRVLFGGALSGYAMGLNGTESDCDVYFFCHALPKTAPRKVMFGRVDAILHTLTLQPLASDDNDAVMMALLSRHVWDPAGFVAANWQALSAFLQVKDVLHYHWVRAKGNWDHFLRQPRVLARKYLYTLHELFVLMWVLGEGSAPPIHFWTLADRFVKSLAVKEEIMRVYGINQKAKSKADTEMDRSDGLNAYVEGAIAQLEDAVATHHADAAALVFGPVETE